MQGAKAAPSSEHSKVIAPVAGGGSLPLNLTVALPRGRLTVTESICVSGGVASTVNETPAKVVLPAGSPGRRRDAWVPAASGGVGCEPGAGRGPGGAGAG